MASNYKYAVLQNRKPAVIAGCKAWSNHVFNTFDEAEKYARAWLGCHISERHYLMCDHEFEFGDGDYLIIKKVVNNKFVHPKMLDF